MGNMVIGDKSFKTVRICLKDLLKANHNATTFVLASLTVWFRNKTAPDLAELIRDDKTKRMLDIDHEKLEAASGLGMWHFFMDNHLVFLDCKGATKLLDHLQKTVQKQDKSNPTSD